MSVRFFFACCLLLSAFVVSAQQEDIAPEKLLQTLIRFQSESGSEKEVANYLLDFCQQKGLYTEKLSVNDSALNFSASLYPLERNKPNILLISHLDVVPVNDDKPWRHAPFSGDLYGDSIWGRGAIDCKGLAVMQLVAILNQVESAKKQDLPYNITFLGLTGEESSNPDGAAFVVSNYLSRLNPCVVFGEGGSGLTHLVPSKPDLEVFGISIAEKSSLWLKLKVQKKTHGHGAVPPDLYANKRLVKSLINLLDQKREVKFSKISRQMFRDLGEMEGGARGFVIKHINWLVFWPFVKKYFRDGEIFHVLVENTFVITEIATMNSGTANQISDGAYAILDCRLLPGTDTKKFIRRVQFAVGLKVDVEILAESPNTGASKPDYFFKTMQDALKEVYPGSISTPILFPASTDNNFFRMNNIPTFGIIPAVFTRVELEGVHGDNEYLSRQNLKKGIETYRIFLTKIQQYQNL